MTAFLARLDDWSDRISPIVVKEVRQMVRGREFNYSFGISLLAGLIVAFFGLGESLIATGNTGSRVFTALITCLGILGVIVIPLGAFNALRTERADQTLDLITQTPLTPRNIVVGKLMTQWVKLLTLFAGLSPFVAMSFLLGGIDLQTILISLALLFIWSMWVCAACLFLSSASQSRAMGAVVLIGLGMLALWALAAGSSIVFYAFSGGPGISPGSFSETGWVIAGSTALCFVSMTNLVLLAENRLSLAIEDRSTALRVGFFVQYLLILVCIVGPYVWSASAVATGYSASDVVEVLLVICSIHLSITAIFTVTEDMGLSRRVFRRVQKSLRIPWLAIFRPGGGRGALWILTQMLLLLAITFVIGADDDMRWMLAMCGYICFFTGIPTLIVRYLFKDSIRTAYVRASILLFFPIVAVTSDIVQYFLFPGSFFDTTFSTHHILNPFRALGNWDQVENASLQAGPLVMGLLGLIAYLELYRIGRREDAHAAHAS